MTSHYLGLTLNFIVLLVIATVFMDIHLQLMNPKYCWIPPFNWQLFSHIPFPFLMLIKT